jgi:uncharacterized membrane protein YhdT
MENALGTFGKFNAYAGVAITCIIASSLMTSGGILLNQGDRTTKTGTFKVVNVKPCINNTCPADVETPSGNVSVSFATQQVVGANVKLYYDNSKPPNYSTGQIGFPKWFPYVLIISPIFLVILSVMFAYFISSSPTAAKIYGGVAGIQMLTGR